MKFFEATNPLMWLLIKFNLIPYPMIHGLSFTVFSRCVLAAIQLGIFEAVKDSPVTAEEIAEKTGLSARALRSVLNILLILDYFKYKNGKYSLTRMGRKWSLKDGPVGVRMYNSASLDDVICTWLGNMKEYLKTGHGIDVHKSMSEEEWEIYQTGMRNGAMARSDTFAENTPMPENPAAMLDIGGSHGLYCVSMCKKYPELEATIIDLPQAVKRSEPMLKNFYSGNKIKYVTGDALTVDFGENKYDLVLTSHFMHHLSYEDNTKISQKAAKALKPGGYYAIQDYIRFPEPSKKLTALTGVITDIMFNIISTSQTWSIDELKAFQEKAGLKHHGIYDYKGEGLTQVCARKE